MGEAAENKLHPYEILPKKPPKPLQDKRVQHYLPVSRSETSDVLGEGHLQLPLPLIQLSTASFLRHFYSRVITGMQDLHV